METIRSTFRPLPSADYVLYQLFMRDAEDRMTLSTFTDPEQGFEQAMEARLAPNVHSWQLRHWNGERMVMQAVSANWFTLKPAVVMARVARSVTEVVDGLLVEQPNGSSSTYIYFRPNPRPSESCIRIFNEGSLTIMGQVTPEQYAGFLRAVALAPRYMTNP